MAGVSDAHRKSHGLYLTPREAAAFMSSHLPLGDRSRLRILDPAAGAGVLLCAAVESLASQPIAPKRIELVAYEIDAALAAALRTVLDYLCAWSKRKGIIVTADVIHGDFVLRNAPALRSVNGLFPHVEDGQAFDAVIANPPYFKLNKADPRAQAAAAVVHGQPNIYGLFMAIGATMLKDGGSLVFITPRSFASGPYFRLFREQFFHSVRPELVHIFSSRREAFGRDAVLQENVITKGIRQDGWAARGLDEIMAVSSSNGLADLDEAQSRSVRLSDVLNMASHEKVLRLPVSDEEQRLVAMVDSWPGNLGQYGLKISTGPVVPFRATDFIDRTGHVPKTHAPLLWMNHVKPMQVSWPLERHKPEFIKHGVETHTLMVPNRNYVLMRRFSAKEEARRLVAAPYLASRFESHFVGLENHLNYVYRPKGSLSEDEAVGLAALFNSALLDRYFRVSNGNTQVSATELRAMPLPPLETITAIGRAINARTHDDAAREKLVLAALTCDKPRTKKAVARGKH